MNPALRAVNKQTKTNFLIDAVEHCGVFFLNKSIEACCKLSVFNNFSRKVAKLKVCFLQTLNAEPVQIDVTHAVFFHEHCVELLPSLTEENFFF